VWKIPSQFLILRSNSVRNILSIHIDVVKESCLLPLVTEVFDYFSEVMNIHSSF